MLLCFLPADNIAPTYETYFKPTTFPWYDDFDQRKVEKFKKYYEHQWLVSTDKDFMSLFKVETITTNPNERYNKTINAKFDGAHPNLWEFLSGFNELLDQAELDVKRIKNQVKTVRSGPNQTQAADNIDHREEAEKRLLSDKYPDFSEIQFIDYRISANSFRP